MDDNMNFLQIFTKHNDHKSVDISFGGLKRVREDLLEKKGYGKKTKTLQTKYKELEKRCIGKNNKRLFSQGNGFMKRVCFKEDEKLCDTMLFSYDCSFCDFSTGRSSALDLHYWKHNTEIYELLPEQETKAKSVCTNEKTKNSLSTSPKQSDDENKNKTKQKKETSVPKKVSFQSEGLNQIFVYSYDCDLCEFSTDRDKRLRKHMLEHNSMEKSSFIEIGILVLQAISFGFLIMFIGDMFR